MEISKPITRGQVSLLLGFIPLLVAWLYAEVLEYLKRRPAPKLNSDAKSGEFGVGPVGEDANTHLLEGGLLSASSKSQKLSPSILRFFVLDKDFLLEHRLTLRAMSEFGGLLVYYYVCDRTDLFGESTKVYNRDIFWFLYSLLIIVAAMTSFKIHRERSPITGKTILYLNRHQTEEWKGWMQDSFKSRFAALTAISFLSLWLSRSGG